MICSMIEVVSWIRAVPEKERPGVYPDISNARQLMDDALKVTTFVFSNEQQKIALSVSRHSFERCRKRGDCRPIAHVPKMTGNQTDDNRGFSFYGSHRSRQIKKPTIGYHRHL